MLILIEGIVVCFILLIVCTLVLKDGPEKCAVFHEEDAKKRVVELGYITEKELKKRCHPIVNTPVSFMVVHRDA